MSQMLANDGACQSIHGVTAGDGRGGNGGATTAPGRERLPVEPAAGARALAGVSGRGAPSGRARHAARWDVLLRMWISQ